MGDIIEILAQIDRKIATKDCTEIFKTFDEKIKELEALGFNKLGIIENSLRGYHLSYVLVMAKNDKAVDSMINNQGEITFGTLFQDDSVLDTGNYTGDQNIKEGKFIYKGYPGENSEKIYEYHLKLMEESGKKGVTDHLDNIVIWLDTVKKTIKKMTEK